MISLDMNTWRVSDGWSNGAPFQLGWRADHVDIYSSPLSNSQLRLILDDVPCSTSVTLCSGQPYAAGEYSSKALVPYGSVTFTAQVAKASGVVTGLFLYTGASDGQPHDEIDIEFLGADTTQVQFNYYVNGIGGHEVLLPLGFDASLSMHTYTITWQNNRIEWYVDNILLHSVSSDTQALPTHNMRIFNNLWATIGVDTWAGPFTYQQKPIYAYIDSIDYSSQETEPVNSLVIDSTTNSVNSFVADTGIGGGCLVFSMSTTWLIIFMSFLLMMWRITKE